MKGVLENLLNIIILRSTLALLNYDSLNIIITGKVAVIVVQETLIICLDRCQMGILYVYLSDFIVLRRHMDELLVFADLISQVIDWD